MKVNAGSGYVSGSGSISHRQGSADPDPDPDPHQNVMDPQQCEKQYPLSRIRINGIVFTSYASLTGHTRRIIRRDYHLCKKGSAICRSREKGERGPFKWRRGQGELPPEILSCLPPHILCILAFLGDAKSRRGICLSVADPGCLSRIPDPNCLHPGSRIFVKEFKYFNLKKTEKMVSKL